MPELTARLRLIADIRDFARNLQRGAQQAKQAMSGLNTGVGNVQKGLNGANKASKGFFQTLRSNVATQIKAGIMFATLYQALITFRQTIGAAISELLKLDESLRKVQSITKESDESIKALNDSLLKAAREGKLFGQTAGEIAAGMFEIVQSGFDSAEAFDIALVAAQAAATGFTDAATAGKVITGAIKAFGMEASDARRVANILFQTVDTGVVKFEELANGLGVAMAPAAALGVPLEELGAAIGTMTIKGMPAQRAMTSLTRIMMAFLDPSDKAKQAAADMGFSLSAQTVETHGLMGAMKLLNEATGGSNELLADVFDRQRALVGAFTLLNDEGAAYTDILGKMNGAQADAGALAKAWEERQKALTVRLGILRSQVLSLITTALQPAARALSEVVGWFTRLISDELGFFSWIKRLSAITGLTAAWMEFIIAVRTLMDEGGSTRFQLLFKGIFITVQEGIPRLFQLLAILLRVGTWAVEHKPVLIALALAFGAMFVAAHPLLAVFQALFIIVGYASDNWGDWRVRVVSVTAAVLLAVVALNLLRQSFMMSTAAGFLFRGATNEVGFFATAIRNLGRAAKEQIAPISNFFTTTARTAKDAATHTGKVLKHLLEIVTTPVKIARTVTVTTIQKGGELAGTAAAAAKQGLIGGLTKGLAEGMAIGVGAAILKGLAGALAVVGTSVLAFLTSPITLIVLAIIGVIIAAFLIYKYRKEIWNGLKSLGGVLKDFFTEKLPEMMEPLIDGMVKFFTETLPAWASTFFTGENMGMWFGRALMVAILLVFWPAVLVYKFRDKLTEWLSAIGEFLGEIPGQIAELIGDAAGVIIGWIVDVVKWVAAFEMKVIEFEVEITEFVAGLPGRIAEFIGDHWKDVLDWLVDAAKWYAHFVLKVLEFYGKVAEFVAGIPAAIADFIGEHWKDIIEFLIDPTAWWDLFKTLLQEFIDLVTDKIGPMLAGIGEAVVSGIKGGFTTAFEGMGGWIIAQAKKALGPVATGLGKLGGFFKAFGGSIPGGMQDVIDWIEAAEGVTNYAGGLALVGERGAEFVRLPRGADVVRNADMGQALRGVRGGGAGGGNGGGGLSVNAEVNITTSMMKDFEELKKRVLQEVDEQLDEAAARSEMANPRFGTTGAGVPRT